MADRSRRESFRTHPAGWIRARRVARRRVQLVEVDRLVGPHRVHQRLAGARRLRVRVMRGQPRPRHVTVAHDGLGSAREQLGRRRDAQDRADPVGLLAMHVGEREAGGRAVGRAAPVAGAAFLDLVENVVHRFGDDRGGERDVLTVEEHVLVMAQEIAQRDEALPELEVRVARHLVHVRGRDRARHLLRVTRLAFTALARAPRDRAGAASVAPIGERESGDEGHTSARHQPSNVAGANRLVQKDHPRMFVRYTDCRYAVIDVPGVSSAFSRHAA